MNVLKKPFQNYLHYGMIPVDGNLSIPRSKKTNYGLVSLTIFLEKTVNSEQLIKSQYIYRQSIQFHEREVTYDKTNKSFWDFVQR